VDGKIFQVPEIVMVEIMKVVNNLPYGQVAPLANSLTKIILEQGDKKDFKDEPA
jgi:hypothetical protein